MGKSIYSKEYKKTIEKLKKARIEIGLKQEEVAEKLRKPQSYISKMPSKLRKNTMPRRFAPRQFLTISQKVKIGGVF